ncbi:MAG: hypothetical protein U0836_16165 [Pirellulales bacterium]
MYVVTDEQQKDMERRFTYHKPGGDQTERYQAMRGYAREYALMLVRCVPDSRERALALTKLEEAVMWANAGIARNETHCEAAPAPEGLPPGFEKFNLTQTLEPKPEPQVVKVEPMEAAAAADQAADGAGQVAEKQTVSAHEVGAVPPGVLGA